MTKKTKIVATIGPASDNQETLKKMIMAGMNVCRINFSHGTHETNGNVISLIRELSEELKTPVGVMVDLQGPRIRTSVSEEMEIVIGEKVIISDLAEDLAAVKEFSRKNDLKVINLDWPGIVKDVEVGNEILIEDGLKRLRTIEKKDGFIIAEVLAGGIIKNHKGVNIPDAKLTVGAVTEKDERDLEYAMSREVDFIALSFVSNGGEIERVREKMKKLLGRETDLPQIVSKVERKEAIKNIDEIIAASDVIMVARGDLGIEMEESKVVLFQKEIIAKCLSAVRPVIVATQMLDSMINNPIPTRAEVSDVSNAVIDHTDAVMLSGESANGKYPIEAVETMTKIIADTENSPFDDETINDVCYKHYSDYGATIEAAYELAKKSQAKAIVMLSQSGLTAQIISHCRPVPKLLVATENKKTYNQLSMVWGVEAYLFSDKEDLDALIEKMIEQAKKEGKLEKGDKVVEILGKVSGREEMRLVGIKEIG